MAVHSRDFRNAFWPIKINTFKTTTQNKINTKTFDSFFQACIPFRDKYENTNL